jgi:hypothetical protein
MDLASKGLTMSKVEHLSISSKNPLGLKKVPYRGLTKDAGRLCTLLGLTNLKISGKRLGVGANTAE